MLHQLKDKVFKSSQIKLDRSGSFTITLEYSLTEDIVSKSGKRREIPQKGGKSGFCDFSATHPTRKHHKTPSRRRRDRARFRAFLERKKQKKQQISATNSVPQTSNSQPKEPMPQQGSPSSEESVTVSSPILHTVPTITTTSPPPELPSSSSDDSWITVSDDTPLESPTQPSATPAEPIPVPPQPQASVQHPYPFKTVQERFAELYTNCGHCQLPSGDCLGGLKPCSRCLCRAYCSKECQRNDWKQGHKQYCSEEQGDKVREVRNRMLEEEAQFRLPTGS